MVGGFCPLSAAQLGIWFDLHVRASSAAYNAGDVVEIDSHVDRVALEAALRTVVANTAALRLEFAIEDGQPVQRVVPEVPVELLVKDFSAVADPKQAAWDWVQLQLQRPFDLSRAPLFRYAILKLSARRFLWMYVYHHLIIDGFGVGVVAREVARLYSAILNGEVITGRTDCFHEHLADEVTYRGSAQFATDRRTGSTGGSIRTRWRSGRKELRKAEQPRCLRCCRRN